MTAPRRTRGQLNPKAAAPIGMPAADDPILRREFVAMVAERLGKARNVISHRFHGAEKAGIFVETTPGTFRFGDVATWARNIPEWSGTLHHFPNNPSHLTASMVLPMLAISSRVHPHSSTLEEANDLLIAANRKIDVLEVESAGLRQEKKQRQERSKKARAYGTRGGRPKKP